jgi:hypothetical protein
MNNSSSDAKSDGGNDQGRTVTSEAVTDVPESVNDAVTFCRQILAAKSILACTPEQLADITSTATHRTTSMELTMLSIIGLLHPDEQSAVKYYDSIKDAILLLPPEWKTLFLSMVVSNVYTTRGKPVPTRYLVTCLLHKDRTCNRPFYQMYADVYHAAWFRLSTALFESTAPLLIESAAAHALDALSMLPFKKNPCVDTRVVSLYAIVTSVLAAKKSWSEAAEFNQLAMQHTNIPDDQRTLVLLERLVYSKATDRYDLAVEASLALIALAQRRPVPGAGQIAEALSALGALYSGMRQHDRALNCRRCALAHILEDEKECLDPLNLERVRRYIKAFNASRTACLANGPFVELEDAMEGEIVPCKWRVCAGCDKVGKNHLKCSGCKRVFYCNVECQKKHWATHRPACDRCGMCKKMYSHKVVKPIHCVDCAMKTCCNECFHSPKHGCLAVQMDGKAEFSLLSSNCQVCGQVARVQIAECSCNMGSTHMVCDSTCSSIHRNSRRLLDEKLPQDPANVTRPNVSVRLLQKRTVK